jgi:hypothetical protein
MYSSVFRTAVFFVTVFLIRIPVLKLLHKVTDLPVVSQDETQPSYPQLLQ